MYLFSALLPMARSNASPYLRSRIYWLINDSYTPHSCHFLMPDIGKPEPDFDIIVVGAGAAGSSAALSAAETSKAFDKKHRIVMLDRKGEDSWGGNSRWTTANFRMLDENHLYPTFEEDIIKNTKDKANPEYVRKLAVEAVDTIHWIRDNGVKLEERPADWTANDFKMGPKGGGLEIITALREKAERFGVSVMLETTAYKLLQDEIGAIEGIFVRDKKGKGRKLTSRAVILGGGGFEGNYEMLTKYMGPKAAFFRLDTPATKDHMGECINMALEAGAAPSGEFAGYHGDLVDPRSSAFRPIIRCFPYGILVNSAGERFIDEGMDDMSNAFEYMARATFEQPGHRSYFIFDEKVREVVIKNVKTSFPPYSADTLKELAVITNLPYERLAKTVQEFNNSVQPGTFNPAKRDGKCALGLSPRKSNWAVEIDKPPFYCYPAEGTMMFTYGGVATDAQARIIDTNGAPIQGLYAAGEMTGLYYHHYTPGTSVLRALTFGRIAGFEAVRWIVEE